MVGIRRFKLIIGIFIPFFAFFLMSQNTFAENFTVYYRSYQIGSDPVVNQSGYNQTGSSVTILDYTSNQTKLLKGFTVENDITDNSTYDYKKLIYKLDLFQPATSGNSFLSDMSMRLAAETTDGTKWSSDCSFQNGITMQGTQSSGHALVTCSIVVTGTVRHAQLVLGTVINATSSSANIGYTMPPGNSGLNYGNASIYAYNVGYTLSGTNDPEMQYLNQISSAVSNTNILIQEQIEQQNQNTQDIIDNQNQNTQDIIRSNQNCRLSYNLFNYSGSNLKNSTASISGTGDDFTISTNEAAGYIAFPLGLIDYSTLYLYYTNNYLPNSILLAVTDSSSYNSLSSYNSSKTIISTNLTSKSFDVSSYSGKYLWIQLRGSFANSGYYSVNYTDFVASSHLVSSYESYGEEICKNINEEYYDEQRQADQNISNQNSSDIQGAENQQTTNLIGVLSNFVTQLTNFQATTCELTLPFPSFVGGNQVVNICQGKDVLGNFITVIGTLIMITFYIPLVISILKMIYNEIRSFTNG